MIQTNHCANIQNCVRIVTQPLVSQCIGIWKGYSWKMNRLIHRTTLVTINDRRFQLAVPVEDSSVGHQTVKGGYFLSSTNFISHVTLDLRSMSHNEHIPSLLQASQIVDFVLIWVRKATMQVPTSVLLNAEQAGHICMKWHLVFVYFISRATCVGLQEEEPQGAHSMSFR